MKKQQNIFARTESLLALSQNLLWIVIGMTASTLAIILVAPEGERAISLLESHWKPIVTSVIILLIFFVYMSLTSAFLKWRAKKRWCEKKVDAFRGKVNAMRKEAEAQRVCHIELKDELYVTKGLINPCAKLIEQYSFDEGMNLMIDSSEFDKVFFQDEEGILFYGVCLEEKEKEMNSLLQYLSWLFKVDGKSAPYSLEVFVKETFEIIMSSQKPLLLPEEKVPAES